MKYRYDNQTHICLFDQGKTSPEWLFVGFANSPDDKDKSEFAEHEINVSLAHCAEAGEAFTLLGLSPKEMADKIQLLKRSYSDVSAAVYAYMRCDQAEKSAKFSVLESVMDKHYKIIHLNY